MGSYHLNIPTRGSLADAFSSLPTGAKTFLKEGFGILAKVPAGKLQPIVAAVIDSIYSGYGAGLEDLRVQTGIPPQDLRPMLAAASFMAAVLTSRNESPDGFVRLAIANSLIDEQAKDAIVNFAQSILSERSAVQQAFKHSELTGAVLPSLASFETLVELRLAFEGEQIGSTVPVIVVHLDTDARNQEVWFQLSKKQLERLIKDLEIALKRVEQAERWPGAAAQSRG